MDRGNVSEWFRESLNFEGRQRSVHEDHDLSKKAFTEPKRVVMDGCSSLEMKDLKYRRKIGIARRKFSDPQTTKLLANEKRKMFDKEDQEVLCGEGETALDEVDQEALGEVEQETLGVKEQEVLRAEEQEVLGMKEHEVPGVEEEEQDPHDSASFCKRQGREFDGEFVIPERYKINGATFLNELDARLWQLESTIKCLFTENSQLRNGDDCPRREHEFIMELMKLMVEMKEDKDEKSGSVSVIQDEILEEAVAENVFKTARLNLETELYQVRELISNSVHLIDDIERTTHTRYLEINERKSTETQRIHFEMFQKLCVRQLDNALKCLFKVEMACDNVMHMCEDFDVLLDKVRRETKVRLQTGHGRDSHNQSEEHDAKPLNRPQERHPSKDVYRCIRLADPESKGFVLVPSDGLKRPCSDTEMVDAAEFEVVDAVQSFSGTINKQSDCFENPMDVVDFSVESYNRSIDDPFCSVICNDSSVSCYEPSICDHGLKLKGNEQIVDGDRFHYEVREEYSKSRSSEECIQSSHDRSDSSVASSNERCRSNTSHKSVHIGEECSDPRDYLSKFSFNPRRGRPSTREGQTLECNSTCDLHINLGHVDAAVGDSSTEFGTSLSVGCEEPMTEDAGVEGTSLSVGREEPMTEDAGVEDNRVHLMKRGKPQQANGEDPMVDYKNRTPGRENPTEAQNSFTTSSGMYKNGRNAPTWTLNAVRRTFTASTTGGDGALARTLSVHDELDERYKDNKLVEDLETTACKNTESLCDRPPSTICYKPKLYRDWNIFYNEPSSSLQDVKTAQESPTVPLNDSKTANNEPIELCSTSRAAYKERIEPCNELTNANNSRTVHEYDSKTAYQDPISPLHPPKTFIDPITPCYYSKIVYNEPLGPLVDYEALNSDTIVTRNDWKTACNDPSARRYISNTAYEDSIINLQASKKVHNEVDLGVCPLLSDLEILCRTPDIEENSTLPRDFRLPEIDNGRGSHVGGRPLYRMPTTLGCSENNSSNIQNYTPDNNFQFIQSTKRIGQREPGVAAKQNSDRPNEQSVAQLFERPSVQPTEQPSAYRVESMLQCPLCSMGCCVVHISKRRRDSLLAQLQSRV